ncbi:hypothetical protein K2173_006122 [Erythroxylum novogranatense]|uniref:Protein kinase domain-containing protein n=1 Tax=Erythroxylum novogranatense TaxID=1862640 RepID=A0AAV8TBY8_9ROSI|nr:hypothetical protein K2173_006122 [Erythroxylum novogranatense]
MEWVRGETIGCGSTSTVSLAMPKRGSDRCMAVKSCSAWDSALVVNEKVVLNELGSCPHIIKSFGGSCSVENGERFYNLLLEYAPGGSLANRVTGGCLPESDVKRYTRAILKGLSHIHAKGFVHCDIKLHNLLLSNNGEVKIADFGLAKRVGEKQSKEKQRRPEIRGTPLYMSPESVNENEYETPGDIWALGCSVVEMITGKPAWNCKPETNVAALLIRIGVGDELPTIPQDMSEHGKDFLSKCFVKDPRKRWTAEMLLDHPFVSTTTRSNESSVTLKGHQQSLPSSPRGHFDFPDCFWDQPSPTGSESCSGAVEESRFEWSVAPEERVQRLASDEKCKWSDSESWVCVR